MEIVSLEGMPEESRTVAELDAASWWAKELAASPAFEAMCGELGKRADALTSRLVSARTFDDPRAEDRARGQIAGLRFAEGLVAGRLEKLARAADKERAARAAR